MFSSNDQKQPKSFIFKLKGITCGACAVAVTSNLKKTNIAIAEINAASQSGKFTLLDGASLADLKQALEKNGVFIESAEQTSSLPIDHSQNRLRFWMNSTVLPFFIISFLLTLPFWIDMAVQLKPLRSPAVALVLATPVYLICLGSFGRSALYSLKRRRPNMDLLIILSVSSAYLYSLILIFLNLSHLHHLLFETSSSITTFVLLGSLLERSVTLKAAADLKALEEIAPQAALRVNSPEIVEKINTDQIVAGDLLLANLGDRLAADGVVTAGNASLDQSAITGESLPLLAESGSKVLAGSIVTAGQLIYRSDTAFKESLFGKIIQSTKDAHLNKPQIERLADVVSFYFVPSVAAFALLTFVFSFLYLRIDFADALLRSIAVLAVACPCAMGLATPTAVFVALGRAAKLGIFARGGDVLEKLTKIKKIIFDKTGTLTSKELRVVASDCENLPRVKEIVAALSNRSSHPIQAALAKSLSLEDRVSIQIQDLVEMPGLGVKAKDQNDNDLKIGSYRFLEDLNPPVGHTVYVAENNIILGWFDIGAEIKTDAPEVIASLKKEGFEIGMLSGDRETNCKRVSDLLWLDWYLSDQLPDDKLSVLALRRKAGGVIFVGDGVNDAPSLKAADVGISFGDASALAIENADVVLFSANLKSLLEILRLAAKTVRIIKQNLFWAFLYNLTLIPLAAGGVIKPTLAAFIMAFSDVFVVANSLRLRR
ncbi:MAG TPA: cation-translocating P-type ATPase [Oligoflexia bacterium]|nr:cation-translocating P-type ATPase [Oligoflexia bacterium]HMP26604.1 cation-translocating P-type ATPase [Oligoflexia bacterium]